MYGSVIKLSLDDVIVKGSPRNVINLHLKKAKVKIKLLKISSVIGQIIQNNNGKTFHFPKIEARRDQDHKFVLVLDLGSWFVS